MDYTERIDGIQIRDVVYFGLPPVGTPPRFDVVKWYPDPNPHMGTVFHIVNGRVETSEELIKEHCYSLGFLEWDEKERCFQFQSIGMRWLEEHPSREVEDMILKFCKEKEQEMRDLD